jgi:hypothetical protein
MNRFLLICHVVAALACAAWADSNIRILQVGLDGRCGDPGKQAQQ